MRYLAIATLLGSGAITTAHATPFTVSLDGGQEVPSVATTGIGSGRLQLNRADDRLTVSFRFEDLLSPTIFAHIHCCAAVGANGPVAIDLAGFPLNVTEGAYFRVFDLTQASTYGSAFFTASGGTVEGARTRFVDALNDELTYINVHTARFRPGEIRGQILVSAPAAAALFGLGALAMGVARGRRAR